MKTRFQTGSALLVALIAIAVLMVLVVAAIQFTGVNREGAGAKLRGDELQACAETAKRLLLTQLNSPATPLNNNTYDFELPNRVDSTERTHAMTGHYQQDGGVGAITSVSGTSISVSSRAARDLSNGAPASAGFGGTPYKVVMKCQDSAGRESEVEFVFKYGI